MTNQIQGEVLFDGWPGTSADGYVYSPWMTVRGDVATFGVEIVVAGGGTLTWDVETRKLESATTTVITSASAVTTAGVSLQKNTTACEQLVRYRMRTSSTVSTTAFVMVRALQPSWQVNR
jgi:hypothetical protein